MNELLKSNLNELLNFIIVTLKDTKELVVANTPAIIKEIITYNITACILEEIVFIGFIILGILVVKKWYKDGKLDNEEWDILSGRTILSVFIGIGVVILTIYSICIIFDLIKWTTAPKLAVLEKVNYLLAVGK